MNVTHTHLLIAALAAVLCGCGTMDVTQLKTHAAASYAQHAEKKGLVVAVHPVTDRKEIDEVFKTDLLDKGLLPILVVAENRSSSASFILAREKVYVLNEATGVASGNQRTNITSETGGQATALAGAAVLLAASAASLPLVFAGLKMASDASVIQHNMADKEFYTRTLAPGDSAQGFVYFRFAPETPISGAYRLRAEATDSSTSEIVPFDFDLNLRLTKP